MIAETFLRLGTAYTFKSGYLNYYLARQKQTASY